MLLLFVSQDSGSGRDRCLELVKSMILYSTCIQSFGPLKARKLHFTPARPVHFRHQLSFSQKHSTISDVPGVLNALIAFSLTASPTMKCPAALPALDLPVILNHRNKDQISKVRPVYFASQLQYRILDGYPASLGFPIMHRVHAICTQS